MAQNWRPSPASYRRADIPRNSHRLSWVPYTYATHVLQSRRCKQLGIVLLGFLVAAFIYLNFSLGNAVHRRLHIEKADPYAYGYGRDGEKYSDKPIRVTQDSRMPLLEKVRQQLSQSNAGASPDGEGFVQSIDQRWKPTLHLLLRGGQRTAESCRTIASAAINGYPPAHMIPLDGRNRVWDPVSRMKRASAVQ
ncbi:Enzyme that catalyzes the fourth step in the histidine pathway, partial [Ascosphaera pollenicola]